LGTQPGRSGLGTLAPLASAVRSRRASAVELVEECLRRIEAARDLGAVVALRPAEALDDARALDALVARGEDPGPLAGLPLLVKDIEDARGLPTTFGSLLHRDGPPAAADGVVAGRLRAAGAILVGKTNVPEFAFEGYTANRAFGATRNPWAPAWSPGGSSGGSAAALAAGLAPLATATDVGGSIRIPAAACGLVGLKPTAGHIGRDPILASLELNNHGPLATTVADARLLLDLLAGPVAGDPGALPRRVVGPSRRPARLLATERFVRGAGPLPPGPAALFAAALEALARALDLRPGRLTAEEVLPSGYEEADWFRLVATEQAYALGRGAIEGSADLLDPTFLGYMLEAFALPQADYQAARRRRLGYTRELDSLLGDDGVLDTPTLTVEGWQPDGRLPGAETPGLPSRVFDTEPFNLTGHPAVSLPAGRHANGVPFGIQVAAPRGAEELLFWVAERWEAASPWPLVADGYRPFAL
jgi:amidase/aspartyl-tRNA(Asn)/glutamyl-tRNA(Gln) amidotransferase subunit A